MFQIREKFFFYYQYSVFFMFILYKTISRIMIFESFYESNLLILGILVSFFFYIFCLCREHILFVSVLVFEKLLKQEPEKSHGSHQQRTFRFNGLLNNVSAFRIILCWLTTKLLSLFITFICNCDDIHFNSFSIYFSPLSLPIAVYARTHFPI